MDVTLFPALNAKHDKGYEFTARAYTLDSGTEILSIKDGDAEVKVFLDVIQLQQIFGVINNHLDDLARAEREAEFYAEAVFDKSLEEVE